MGGKTATTTNVFDLARKGIKDDGKVRSRTVFVHFYCRDKKILNI